MNSGKEASDKFSNKCVARRQLGVYLEQVLYRHETDEGGPLPGFNVYNEMADGALTHHRACTKRHLPFLMVRVDERSAFL